MLRAGPISRINPEADPEELARRLTRTTLLRLAVDPVAPEDRVRWEAADPVVMRRWK